jgi:hypothetical protein
MTAQAPPVAPSPTERVLPPVVEVTVGALILAIAGGIYMAAYFPHRPPLGIPIALLVVSAALLGVALGMLVRVRDFGWKTFRLVAGWTLLAYILQGGMIGYAFVHNHASGAPLVVVLLLLVIFAVSVPLMISFTVGRYQVQ